ncbi:MAG: hypothetical protein J6D02_01830 [Lachnospira sp.]|nr:hypothetical protein [Lachnospira sp.]
MNRWKSIITLLLVAVLLITNSMISYADEGNQDSAENIRTASGEGSGDASGDISGDASGEGEKEYVTISFYDDGKLVKMVQVERGSTVEWWEPKPYSDAYMFKGWYYLISETQGMLVTSAKTYDTDMNLHAYWEDNPNWRGPVDPINLEEKRQEFLKKQEEIDHTRRQTYKTSIKFKDITIKKNGSLSLKIRSTHIPQSLIVLEYSTSKNFAYNKTKTKIVKRTKNTSVKKYKKITIKKLKKNKTYYIRARIKSECNGQTFLGKWSKVQKVKMKEKKKK